MRYILEKKTALKIFYYFMAIDGNISDEELNKFDDIISEIAYEGDRTEIMEECENYLCSMDHRDNTYDYILEAIDKEIAGTDDKINDGVVRRLLVWDLFALSFSDGDFSEEEKRLINHIGRVLEIDKSVLLDMEQLTQTALAIVKELSFLDISCKPYAEIRPLVEEVERRKQVIMKAAIELIDDDYFVISKMKGRNNPFAAMGEKTQKGLKAASDAVGTAAVKSALGIKNGANKIFETLKKSEIKLPKNYKKIKGKFSEDMGLPSDAYGYEMTDGDKKALIICFDVDEESSMPFDNNEAIIRSQCEKKNPNEVLVEVNSGTTKNGAKYVYMILKCPMPQEDGLFVGTEYTMDINIKAGDTIKFLKASFTEEGITGMRDADVYELIKYIAENN